MYISGVDVSKARHPRRALDMKSLYVCREQFVFSINCPQEKNSPKSCKLRVETDNCGEQVLSVFNVCYKSERNDIQCRPQPVGGWQKDTRRFKYMWVILNSPVSGINIPLKGSELTVRLSKE